MRLAEDFYEHIFNTTAQGVFQSTPKGRYLRVNAAMAKIYGYATPEEMVASVKDIAKQIYVKADARARFKKLLEENNVIENFEAQNKRKDGTIIWTSADARAVRDASGKVQYYAGFVRDVTVHKRIEKTLGDAETQYRILVEQAPVAVYIDAPVDNIETSIYISPQIQKITGYTSAEWIARGFWPSVIHPDDHDCFVRENERTNQTGDPFDLEYRILHKDGRIVWLRDIANLARDAEGNPLYWHGTLIDITEQKLLQQTIRQSEARHRALVEHIPAIVYMDSAEKGQKTLYISPQVETVLGYTPAEWIADPHIWENSIHPEDRERVLKKDILTEETGESFSEEYRIIARDGRAIWIQEESSLIRDEAGNPLYWQGFLLNITGKKEAQETMREIANAYRGLFDSITDAIYIQDRFGRFLDVNLGAVKMYGHPHKFFIGKTPEILSAPGKNNLEAVVNAVERAFEGVPQQFEFWGIRKNDEVFPKDVRLYKGTYFGQDVVFAIARDITSMRRAQDAQERQLKELSVLHALTVEGTRAANEDELIERATEIIGYTLYPDILGFLMITEDEKCFYPHSSYRGITDPGQIRKYQIGEGVAGQVAATGKSMNIPDVRKVKKYIQIDPKSLSELCVPMAIGERVIGVINAESSKLGFFTAEDERLLVTIAGQLATAIERLRKERAEREQRILAEALRDIASALNSTLDFDTVLDRILENIGRVVPSKSANIMLLENNVLRIIRHRGYTHQGATNWRDHFSETINNLPDLRQGAQTHEPQLILDTQKDPGWVTFPATEWIRSCLSAPILQDGEAIGFINLDHDTPNFFSQRDAEWLMAFTNQAASAVENSRLFEEQSRRAKIIEALAEIANVIATTREIGVALDEIAQRSLNLLNASHIAIYILQDDDQTLKIVAAKGSYHEKLLSHAIKIGQGITGNIVAAGKPEIINDTAQDPRKIKVPGTPEEDSRIETMMSAPLISRGKAIGAMNAWRLRADGLFSESELNFLVSIAHQASIAIESGRLFEETVRRAQESAAIAEVGRDISSTLQLDAVFERIASYAKDLLQAETSAVYLADLDANQLRASAALGTDADAIKNDPLQIGSGILGNIALQKSGEIVNDTAADPRAITIKGTGENPAEHIMGVPVLLKDKLTGLLAVWRIGQGRDYKTTDLEFLSGLAQQAAIAIENARLYQSEQQRRQEAENLREATAIVATTLDQGRAIELILDQLARVLKYDSASIQLLRDEYLEIVGGRGWQSESSVLGLRFPIPGNNPNTIVVQERRPLILNKIVDTFEPFHKEPHSHIHSWLGAPLIAHGEVIGMLSVDSAEEGYFTEEHVRLVTAYANQAAIAIDNAQLHEKSENQVRRLTALRDVDTAIASSLDLRVTLNILMDNAASQLRADAMSILVYNPNVQILETVATLGFQGGLVRRQFRIGEGLAGKIAMTRKPLRIQELMRTDEYAHLPWLADEKFVTYIGYPLLGKGQVKGALEAFFRASFTPDNDWLEFMQTMAGQAAIAIDNSQLFENLQRSNQELSLAYDTTLEGWGKALELRDKETEGHTRRVTELTIRLARRMNISDSDITHIRRGVLLHDIGKMGVPDHILRKTGPLDNAEWKQMRQHPQYAYDLLYPIAYLRPALDIPLCHHENWDGSGYPRGLKGDEIPLAARIFSVVDVWDALLSDRPYRKTWSRKRTIEYIQKETGIRFDPRIANIFLEMVAETE